ncbi:MAG: hypothetical protein M0D53_12540 [Flavobacterium sp. JAD_PAG50586_2]|nr:MAG: hypothetical protein M0D53_12540 [Flavobacterium sp. JAD_PAG50586_2]
MKKYILLLFLFSLNIYSQDISIDGKDLGLVGYLTYVKTISEAKMTSLVNDENYTKKPEKALKFNSEYTLLKLSVDQLINQLSADLLSKNRLKLYRSLDNYLKNGEKLPEQFSHYSKLIERIDGQLQAFLIRKYKDGGPLAGASIEEITGVASEVREIITSARDFREKKIQSIYGIIKELKLAAITELIKPKEKGSKD